MKNPKNITANTTAKIFTNIKFVETYIPFIPDIEPEAQIIKSPIGISKRLIGTNDPKSRSNSPI